MPSHCTRCFARLLAAVLLIVALAFVAHPGAQQKPADIYGQMKYRHIGPVGNRAIAVVGEPGNLAVYYVGAASGGILKTIDGGAHWVPIFDDQPAQSVGSLAIAPSDQQIVWAGTGETFIRSNISIGNGIYKSTDGGRTWTHMGLETAGRIGRIVIDPHDPDIVFAAVMGHSYGPQPDRGLFRTRDGGKTWEKVLFVDENTGCSDVAMDPNNPRILFAGMWQLTIHTWNRDSGGPGSGLYMSRDGGTTWKHLTGHGLPEFPLGKIGVGVAQRNSNRVYALMEASDPGLWRSDDGGETWKVMNRQHAICERAPYYTRFAIAPDDENRIYFLSVSFNMSLDGGETLVKDPPRGGGDTHDMWIDPLNPARMAVADDQGVNITINRGQTWHSSALPVAQIYHVYTDNQIPYYVYGNRQDGNSYKGPSNSREASFGESSAIALGLWHSIGGCESGFGIPDPVDNNIVWSGCYDGGLDRYDDRTRQVRSVRVWPDPAYGWAPADVKYRFQWTFPIAISPHDHNTVYVGSQFVHQTADGGQTWRVISPDLTTNDKSHQQQGGGLTRDRIMVEDGSTLFAIAESPKEKGLIWTGSNDGVVQVTRDGGAHWTNVTANIPNLPPWGTVSNIEPSRYDAGTAYITVDFHQANNRDPFIYKTTDYGRTWTSVSGDIPKSVFSYVHVVREDPVKKGLLYAGTENALYVSYNDGATWVPLQSNLPHAPVHWLTIQEHFSDLVVATYGRGFWILDDISPLRAMTGEVLASAAHLFPPRPAYRFRYLVSTEDHPDRQGVGQNPPYGADLTYYLKSAPAGDVKVTILDAKGETVRSLTGTKEAGINRIWWDLRYEAPTEVKLRTSPPGKPWVVRFGPDGSRPLVNWSGKPAGPLVLPGTYTVRLSVGGKEFTEKLTVKKDPNSAGTEADVQAQFRRSIELRDNLETVATTINEIEWMRRQIEELKASLQGGKDTAAVIKAAEEVEKKVLDVEVNFYDLNLTGQSEDSFRAPMRLYEKLSGLADDVGNASADFQPTAAMIEVHELYKKQLASYRSQYESLLGKEVAAFNNLLRERNIQAIGPRAPRAPGTTDTRDQ